MLVENLKFLTGHTHVSKTGDLVTAIVTHNEFTHPKPFFMKNGRWLKFHLIFFLY